MANQLLLNMLFSHNHPTTMLLQPNLAIVATKSCSATAGATITTTVGDVQVVNGKKQPKVDLEGKSLTKGGVIGWSKLLPLSSELG